MKLWKVNLRNYLYKSFDGFIFFTEFGIREFADPQIQKNKK